MARRPPIHLNLKELEEIKLLRASGMTFHAIGLKIGRDKKTVKSACMRPEVAMAIEEAKEELADMFESIARRMIESITDEEIEKLNPYQRCISAGIATDKMRLLRNESTSNFAIETIHVNREDREKRRIELEKRLQELTGEDTETRLKKWKALDHKTDNTE